MKVLILVLVLVAATVQASRSASDSLALGRVRASGWLGERVDRSHSAVKNVRSSIWWNLGREWGWEHAGRWLRNMSYFQAYTGEAEPAVAEDAERFVKKNAAGELDLDYRKLQIGPYSDGEVLKGLLAYYDISKDTQVLAVARAVGQRIVRDHHLTSHPYKALAVASLLKLAEAASDPAFRKAAVEIAGEQKLAFLKLKLHGAACAEILDAYLDLYKTTGERKYLDWVLQGWRPIRDRMFATGGLGEVLDFTAEPGESDLMCETCQTSWWMILNLHLWQVTGEVRYLDLAERILYNQFAWGQSHIGEGGGFCAGGNIDQAMRGIHNYFCCDNEGALGFIEVLLALYGYDAGKRTIDVNLFFESEARFDVGKERVMVRQQPGYPARGLVRLSVETARPAEFTLRIRVPGWTRATGVRVNGRPASFSLDRPFVSVKRTWASGDTASVVFPVPMRVEADNTGRGIRSGAVSIEGKLLQAKRLAVLYGPVISAMFRTGHGNDLSWIWTGGYPDVLDSGGDAQLGYPGSKPDTLEHDGRTFDSGGVAKLTTVQAGASAPLISWTADLGGRARVRHSVRVLPGLPVTIESREEVSEWDGKGRLLCSGLRFATTKDASSGYGVCSIPYPAPVVITKPDLDNHVVWAGVFGLSERLSDNAEMPRTGVFFLNNGYFSAICAYDPASVGKVVCRQTDKWTGLYLEPLPGSDDVLVRKTVFPLASEPLNQTSALQNIEKAKLVTSVVRRQSGAETLVLSGPVLQGAPVLVPRAAGLKAGWIIHGEKIASEVLEYDEDSVLVYADVPGTYAIERARLPQGAGAD